MNTTVKTKIENFLADLKGEIDYTANVDIDSLSLESPELVFDEISDQLTENNAFDIEIIYYATAIEYLRENDPSLRTSLELASEMGFELKNLNSEILASLLASEYAREEFGELESEITDFFEEIAEELETQESED